MWDVMSALIYSIIYSILTMTINTGLYVFLTGLMQTNISIYGMLNSINYRNVFNYIVTSSVTLVIIMLGYVSYGVISEYISIICLVVILIKLSGYPYTNWSLPIYKSMKITTALIIIIVSKIIYMILINDLNYNQLIWILIYITMIGGAIGSINNFGFLNLIVYSGTVQLGYLMLPIITGQIWLFNIYLMIYLTSIVIMYLNLNSKTILKVRYIELSIIIYMLIGIPPFIGFYIKYFTFLDFFKYANYIYDLPILVLYVFSSLLISYFYLNFLNSVSGQYYNYPIKWISYFITLIYIMAPIILYNGFIL